MHVRVSLVKKLSLVSTAALLLFAVGSASAFAQDSSEMCPNDTTRTSLETRVCVNGATIKRACCLLKDGKTKCKHWPHCPKKSV